MSNKLSVTSRILAAVFAGYALANVSSIFITLALSFLSIAKGNAFVFGALFSFAVWIIAIMWCFYAKSALRAWLGLVVPAGVLGAFSFLMS